MEFISNCTADAISNAAKALKDGHLVAFPTETVYGLGADATNEKAVSRIYSVKGRPSNHPLIVHISSINKLEKWATDIPDYAIKLAREFWPGPLTLILPRTNLAKDYITGGQNNVGLRVPDNPIALSLLRRYEEMGGLGVAAPSANRFGAVSPTCAEAVQEELGDYLGPTDLVLDGGRSLVGIESTIINCSNPTPQVLRPGVIFNQLLYNVTKIEFENPDIKTLKVSGNLNSHYRPKARVLINKIPKSGDGLIALDSIKTPNGVTRLSSPKNTQEMAREFYGAFRKADNLNINTIHIILPTGDGIELALYDRAFKASQSN